MILGEKISWWSFSLFITLNSLSIEILIDIIKKIYDFENIIDRYLKILDSTRADIPENLQQYWIDNQDRLGLKGKFLPDNSNLISHKKEA